MKDQIIELQKQGKSYNEICEILGCSKGTVSYHCGVNQKDKARKRQQKNRADSVISCRVGNFQYDRKVKDKAEDFQRERIVKNGKPRLGKRKISFSWKDVIEKFGWETECYLTGRKINLKEPRTYQFDHIISVAQNGSSRLDNLGILCKEANKAKSDLSVDGLIALCKEILEHQGYDIRKRSEVGEEPVSKTAGA